MNPRKKSKSIFKSKQCSAICTSMSIQCIAPGNGQQVSVTAFPIVSAKKQNKTRREAEICSSMTVYTCSFLLDTHSPPPKSKGAGPS